MDKQYRIDFFILILAINSHNFCLMQFRLFSIILTVFISLFPASDLLLAEGYNIQVQVTGISNQEIILAHYVNKSMYPDDTTKVNAAGIGAFSGENILPQGMYIVYLPSGQYFQILVGADQRFRIATDTINFVNNATIEGSADNEIFFDF